MSTPPPAHSAESSNGRECVKSSWIGNGFTSSTWYRRCLGREPQPSSPSTAQMTAFVSPWSSSWVNTNVVKFVLIRGSRGMARFENTVWFSRCTSSCCVRSHSHVLPASADDRPFISAIHCQYNHPMMIERYTNIKYSTYTLNSSSWWLH